MSEPLKIRVILSFGSDDKERKRMAAVYYSCLEFMIDKYSSESDQPFDFDYCKRFTGDINDPLLQEIADADILIALLDRNVTVRILEILNPTKHQIILSNNNKRLDSL